MRKGYIQVYTGNSKGKTTAALGLALRAAGAGLKVFILQFIKKRKCSEHKALERFKDLITVRQCGTGFLKSGKPTRAEIAAAKKGFEEIKKAISSKKYGVVILDEINIAVHNNLIAVEELLDLLEKKPPEIELILTGRYADKRVIDKADLVTEMKEIKHYFRKGIKARVGIEC
ncbi:MAG: cob(I)yrinic acid a,c-diamide adenosyltransferase [Nitrospirae bacterium GWC2_46_6]|nr:MAG: cob(I)yrinic acid a,c-diamide adenosyltransferase [Nitrospirae bacterium GWA2_46_11]OGW22404.1 MAG: cob(I)yrinic acid a,c-diamide adenosyltransferase [Nitrospirae bacterium GWC2_46_6]OGW24047.1 MAG: cob(I)yrinic acid a,c-diamide adenosyltransferase [Nitrospirae bacterium GWB2_47_37]HAK88635.1 cob(I)yrinic acid a,c-diamide adenosyltransferase [Nitrospiraceae bacterium]HCZ12295.1 cob(I)yrinic acid a,c-diamide adenosyltransferase [Nitrospiraceae bacterium]